MSKADVRSIIYGEPNLMQALLMAHRLKGFEVLEQLSDCVRFYRIKFRSFHNNSETVDEFWDVLDLSWTGPWGKRTRRRKGWEPLLDTAYDLDLSYEYIALDADDDTKDVDQASNSEDYLAVVRSIAVEIPEPVTDEKEIT